MNKHRLLAALACLLWSTAFVFVKEALTYWPPFLLAGVRFMLAGLLLIPFCRPMTSPIRALCNHPRPVILVSLFQTILLYGTFFFGMQFVRGAQGAIVIGSSPLISALTAHVMMHDDKITKRLLLSIGCGISGVVIVCVASLQENYMPGYGEFFGIILLLAGSICSAIGNVVVAKDKGAINPISLNSIQMFLGGIILFIFGMCIGETPSLSAPPRFYASLFWLAAMSAFCFSLWFYLLKHVKVSVLNVWKFLIPIGGAALSWTIIPDESPTILSIIGMLLVCGGIILSQRQKR